MAGKEVWVEWMTLASLVPDQVLCTEQYFAAFIAIGYKLLYAEIGISRFHQGLKPISYPHLVKVTFQKLLPGVSLQLHPDCY